MTIIPVWARPYFVMSEEGVQETNNTHRLTDDEIADMYAFFSAKKDEFEFEYKQIQYPFNISPTLIEEYARNYTLCNTGLALLDLEKAKRQKAKGGKGGNANDGNIRQHWIPRCYMTQFSKLVPGEGEMVRKTFKRVDTRLTSDGNKTPILNKPVSLNGMDFRENRTKKGRTYSAEFELVLSKLETDYSNFKKHTYLPQTLWDYLVITTFFIVFSWRTPEQMQSQHTPEEVEAGLRKGWIPQLIGPLPKMIAHLELKLIHRTRIFREYSQALFNTKYQKPMRLPFSQNPFYTEKEINYFSIWCVYSPDYLLWLKPLNSKHNYTIRDSEFFSDKFMHVIQNHDYRDLYFHLDDTPWEVLIGNKETKAKIEFNNVRNVDYLGFGPLRPQQLNGFSASNFEIGTTRMYSCSPDLRTLILNSASLTISLRSVDIKLGHHQLSIKKFQSEYFNGTVRTFNQDREIWKVEIPNEITTPFYSKYILVNL